MFCSAQRRAIQTAKCIQEGFESTQPIQIKTNCHEHKGTHYKGTTLPGLSLKEIREMVPDIQVQDQDFPDDKTPWNSSIVDK